MRHDERTTVVFSGGGTGGHLYPALALAEALVERRPDVRPFFVGARRGVEARVLPARGVEHLLVPVLGFERGGGLGGLRALPGLVRSLARVAELFQRLRPELVVVTGGYAGAPAGAMAALSGVPLVLQEQNSIPGLTTRLLAPFARQIHVAFLETMERLPARARARTTLSGNPVRPPVRVERTRARRALSLPEEGTLVLVLGGSQGSRALNGAVAEALRGVRDGWLERPEGLHLLWSTGPAHLASVRAELAALGNPRWVRPLGYIEAMENALAAADLAVSRAGAMATSEFLAWGLPAVLVPLPTAAADHQSANALSLEAAGAAVRLPESALDGGTLWKRVLELAGSPERLEAMRAAARRLGRPDAARTIAEALDTLLRPPPRRGVGGAAGNAGNAGNAGDAQGIAGAGDAGDAGDSGGPERPGPAVGR